MEVHIKNTVHLDNIAYYIQNPIKYMFTQGIRRIRYNIYSLLNLIMHAKVNKII